MKFEHITTDPNILGGKPCIAGSRISVDLILEWIAGGATLEEIHKNYSHLSMDALKEAVLFASISLKNDVFIELKKAS